MGQKLMMTAEDAHGDAKIDLGTDKSLLILIKHCRDMKQQETRLRLITLLLLLSCTTLFIISICRNSGSSGQGSAVEQSPAYSKQERVCATDVPQTNFQRLRIDLSSKSEFNKSDGQYIRWDALENYNTEKEAIVIPENGMYFVYLKIALSCHYEDKAADFTMFKVKLHRWVEGYDGILPLMEASDGIACTSTWFRSVFVGQLFDLLKGDHVSVLIENGYDLIDKSSFGVYLV